MNTKPDWIKLLFRTNSSFIPGISFLIQNRRVHLSKMTKDNHPSIEGIIENPVNPLLLSTTLAIAISTNFDHNGILQKYAEGELLNALEEDVTDYMSNVSVELAKKLVNIESDIIEDLMVMIIHEVIDYPINGSSVFYKQMIRDIIKGSLNEESLNAIHKKFPHMRKVDLQELLRLLLYWRVWHLVNPIYSIFPLTVELVNKILRAYGVKYNSLFHNNNDFIDERIEQEKVKINKVLISSDQSNLQKLKDNYTTFLSLQERSRRFYEWNPEELVVQINTVMARKSIYERD